MNSLLLAIVAILVISFGFDTLVELLNLSALKPKLPKSLKDIYDQKKYAKSQKYLRETTKVSLLESAVSTIATLLILVSGTLGRLDLWLREYTQNEIGLAVLFFVVAMPLITLASLPFAAYRTFVIEAKYGFNKTTLSTFILDTLKNVILSLVIGAPIFAIAIGFFVLFGPNAWLYVWVFLTIFQIGMLFIAPAIILPLFNKFTPLAQGELRSAIEAYARKQNFKLEGIYTMDGSKRSSKSNAFFTGFGKFKRIALFDTLIEKHTTEELVAILAHEIGHYQRRHIIKQLVMGVIFSGLTLWIFGQFIGNQVLTEALGFEQPAIYASLVAIGLLYAPISEVFGIISNYFSRKFEFEADSFSITTYDKTGVLATALKKLAADNLTNLTPHPLKVFTEYSHPPVLQRLEAIAQQSNPQLLSPTEKKL